ncbi:MAG: hypothetical protein PHY02_06495 [Phycisphaerae bacterium]|nr:hypothetical protein [Phycisphaerae bacterium]
MKDFDLSFVLVAVMWIGIGFAIGYVTCAIRNVMRKPVELLALRTEVKACYQRIEKLGDAEAKEFIEHVRIADKARGFCERFVSSAKAAEENGKAKITDLVGEAEEILKMLNGETVTSRPGPGSRETRDELNEVKDVSKR